MSANNNAAIGKICSWSTSSIRWVEVWAIGQQWAIRIASSRTHGILCVSCWLKIISFHKCSTMPFYVRRQPLWIIKLLECNAYLKNCSVDVFVWMNLNHVHDWKQIPTFSTNSKYLVANFHVYFFRALRDISEFFHRVSNNLNFFEPFSRSQIEYNANNWRWNVPFFSSEIYFNEFEFREMRILTKRLCFINCRFIRSCLVLRASNPKWKKRFSSFSNFNRNWNLSFA